MGSSSCSLALNYAPILDEKLEHFCNCSPEDISTLVTVAINVAAVQFRTEVRTRTDAELN